MKILLLSASLLGLMTIGAAAGQPDYPGGFGRDRADYIKDNFLSGGELDTAPGASEWGEIAAERGSTNGEENRTYRDAVGASPTHGSDDDEDDDADTVY